MSRLGANSSQLCNGQVSRQGSWQASGKWCMTRLASLAGLQVKLEGPSHLHGASMTCKAAALADRLCGDRVKPAYEAWCSMRSRRVEEKF